MSKRDLLETHVRFIDVHGFKKRLKKNHRPRDIELILHPAQVSGGAGIEGHLLYEWLQDAERIQYTLGMRDASKLSNIDLAKFRRHFPGRLIVCWGSVAVCQDGQRCVPFVGEGLDRAVVVGWSPLSMRFGFLMPAALIR